MLEVPDFDGVARLATVRKRILGTLVSITFDPDPLIAWRAMEAMGVAAEWIARDNPEFVRSHLRRLHWLLSEESGGICRHAPQAMAEIVHKNPGLFDDYADITASLIDDMATEDLDSGFRLALLWAIGRLAPGAPDAAEAVLPTVVSCLDMSDPRVRGLAVWCVVQAGRQDLLADRPDLAEDENEVKIYGDGNFNKTTIKALLTLS